MYFSYGIIFVFIHSVFQISLQFWTFKISILSLSSVTLFLSLHGFTLCCSFTSWLIFLISFSLFEIVLIYFMSMLRQCAFIFCRDITLLNICHLFFLSLPLPLLPKKFIWNLTMVPFYCLYFYKITSPKFWGGMIENNSSNFTELFCLFFFLWQLVFWCFLLNFPTFVWTFSFLHLYCPFFFFPFLFL